MTKVVLVDRKGETVSVVKGPTGPEHRQLAHEVLRIALGLARLEIEDISYVVATGYGRVNVPFADEQITELTCHTKGIFSLFPNVRTAIDIGGQDAKCMRIRDGELLDFVMNDKCAAGSGRFLEIISASLGISLEEMGNISLRSNNTITMSNFCTIFAQQEVVSALSEGIPIENILAGLHYALVGRVVGMARRLRIEADVVLTGGVAKNSGIVRAMKDKLGCELFIPEDPIFTGALGAALLAREHLLEAAAKNEVLPKTMRKLQKATFFN